MSARDQFKKIAIDKGFLTQDQVTLVLEFHQFEGRKRDPIDVAVSLSILNKTKAKEMRQVLAGKKKRPVNAEAAQNSAAAPPVIEAPMAQRAQQAQQAQQALKQGSILSQLVVKAIEAKASDLHLHANHQPFMRVGGILSDGFAPPLAEERFKSELQKLLNRSQLEMLKNEGAVNLCTTFSHGYRLRINVFKAQHGISAAMRLIPPDTPTLSQLNLPKDASKLIEFHQGLVVISGPANCGKSTTLASLVKRLNQTRPLHIVTIEDPIEHLHAPAQSTVTQRQVNLHTESYAAALKASLREDPDVIVIGELRDMETMRVALTASETGHLVLGTLHTRTAETTIARILDAFGDEEAQMRSTLADALKGVLVQQLVRGARGGLVPAVEMMFNNSAIAHCIRKRKLHQLQSLMQSGRGQSMILLEDSVHALQRRKLVSPQTAARILEDARRAV